MNLSKLFIVLVSVISMIAATGCSGTEATTKVEQKYSPIALYFDPLEYPNPFAYSQYYPLFVNYPNDWAKSGLHGYPSSVQYQMYHSGFLYTGDYTIGGYFNPAGNMIARLVSEFNQTDNLEYDKDGVKIKAIKAFDSWSGKSKNFLPPQYEGDLIKRWDLKEVGGFGTHRNGFGNVHAYQYVYYPDSTLNQLIPEADAYLYQTSTLGQFVFNEKGQLERTNAPLTDNKFIKKAKHNHTEMPSECTFEYNELGLCTAKKEIVLYKYDDNPVDTLKCEYRYYYNAHNDLERLDFDGDVYLSINGNTYSFENRTFSINYEYVYDEKGNWKRMYLIMPLNFENSAVLRQYWEEQKSNNPYFENESKYDKNRTIMYKRDIPDYYEKNMEELKAEIAKEKEKELEKEKDKKPEFTAVAAYGLYGKVKSLKTDEKIVNFNKIGNVESGKDLINNIDWAIDYKTPFNYRSGDGDYNAFIIIDGNVRKEEWRYDNDYTETSDEYELDDKGRLIRHLYFEGMSPVTERFTYSGNDKNPSSMEYEFHDELGEVLIVNTYTYLDVDKNGNWLKRKVRKSGQQTDYEGEDETPVKNEIEPSEMIETRKIIYY